MFDDGDGSYNAFDLLDPLHGPMFTTTLSDYGSDHELTKNVGQLTVKGAHTTMPQPSPSKDDDFDWNFWIKAEDRPSPPSPKKLGQAEASAGRATANRLG
jgi:hypothetical protein